MNRRDKILKLIVEDYIKNAAPVSSKLLIEKYGLTYSSATIRNEMNALEQDGYLEKTHTSSGRVPSSKGYRYYIDNLRDRSIDEEFKYHMQTLLDEGVKSVEQVISRSCEILAHMTSLVSVVLGPNSSDEHLVSVQIIPISETSATCVFITDRGYVENKTFVLEEDTKISDVEKCVKLFNERLKGTSISELPEKMEAIRPLLNDYVIEHDLIYRVMLETMLSFAKERLETYGEKELLENPEISNDASKMKKLLSLMNNPDVLRKVSDQSEDDISMYIGGESEKEEDVSIISAKVTLPDNSESNIAILGPKRMDYDKVLSSLEYLVESLEGYFDKDDSEEKEEKEGSNGQRRKYDS